MKAPAGAKRKADDKEGRRIGERSSIAPIRLKRQLRERTLAACFRDSAAASGKLPDLFANHGELPDLPKMHLDKSMQ